MPKLTHHLLKGSSGLLLFPLLGHAIEAAPLRNGHLFEIGNVENSAASTENKDAIAEARGGLPECADLTCTVEAIVIRPLSPKV